MIRPDYLLISLGTNESYRNWNASYFNKEVNLCLDRIAEASPSTEVIFVLPNENYKKINGKYVRLDRPNQIQLEGGPTSGNAI